MTFKKIAFILIFWMSSFLSASSFIYLNDVWEVYSEGFGFWGLRETLGKKGFHFLTSFIFDYNWPARGGLQTRSFPLYQYLLDVQLGFESEPLLKFKGGKAFMSFQYHQTQHPSLEYIGDWQGFDNLNGPNLTQIGELWVQQSFFKDKARLKFGKIDAYLDFNYTNYAQVLLNNSYSQNPAILGFPSYPNQAVGVMVSYYPVKWLTLKASIFDGSAALKVRTGAMGSRLFFNRLGEHALLLNEIDINWNRLLGDYQGSLGLGVWGLTATLQNALNQSVRGTAGAYAFFWQTLYKDQFLRRCKEESRKRELGYFLQWGGCSKEVSPINVYLGTGLTLQNISAHLQDSLSVGAATTFFPRPKGSPFTQSYETSLEATYQFFVLRFIIVQPDFQYIIHPGAKGAKNAIVATLRLMTSL